MPPDLRFGRLALRIITIVGEIVLYVATSIDGFIADPDGEVAWLERFNVEGEDHGYAEFLSEVDSVIMGATTYEQDLSRGGWPYGARPTWVFTHRSLPTPRGATVRYVDGPVSNHIADIRRTSEGAAYLVGGAQLVEQFMEAGAIDQLRLFVVPLILGNGLRLFETSEPTSAELLGTRSYPTGLVELRYGLHGHLR